MDASLLATKLYIPSLSRRLVPRPRLLARLGDGLTGPLTLISAPAGFGKTTLLAEWRASDAGRDLPLAWVSLDEDDNELIRFMAYVIAALGTLQEGLGDKTLAFIQSVPNPSPKAVVTVLVNDLTSSVTETVRPEFALVLDDYHVISAPPVHEAIAFLLEHLPASMHLVILTRVDPPFPLPRLRVRNQLVELRAEQLRFTSDEALFFLNQVMGLSLSADDVAALEQRTEGWIAGLQMAALSMQGQTDVAGFVKVFAGSHRYIMDYLISEVLNRQSESRRDFLLQTSILETLTGDLCNALTGRRDGSGMLEELEQSNLFIVRLDEERYWYRYHQLFAELLRTRLERAQPDRVSELHQRASAWYEANQQIPAALDHALAGKHYDRAARLVEQMGNSLLASGGWGKLLVYLRALPAPLVRFNPALALLCASALVLVGQPQEVESFLSEAERALGERESDGPGKTVQWRGQIAAIRSRGAYLRGDSAQAIEYSRQALALVPAEDLITRGILTLTLGSSLVLDGQLAQASQIFEDARRVNLAAGNLMFALDAAGSLAQVQEAQGQLRRAADTYRDILRLSENRTDPNVVSAHLSLGNVLYEWHQLDGAHDHWNKALTMAEQIYMPDGVILALLWLAKVKWAQRDRDGADAFIRRAATEIQALPPSIIKPYVLAIMARLALACGDAASAARWAEGLDLPSDEALPKDFFLRRTEYLARVSLLIAEGQLDEAERCLDRLQSMAVSTGLTGGEVEIRALQALVRQGRGDRSGALAALTQALKRAEPEGYIETFVDLGTPMAELLRAAASRGMGSDYLYKLLALLDEPGTGTGSHAPALVEALSERELEVLRLVAQGRSNQQIAKDLVVATGTVKKHISNIFAKLNVESRTQAVARARELDLL